MRPLVFITTALLLWIAPSVVWATASSTLEQQRQWFKQAKQALQHDDTKRFNQLNQRLHNYILRPYLEIWKARKALKQGHDKHIADLIQRYNAIPETINLRHAWLKSLAKRGHWEKVHQLLEQYPSERRRLPVIQMMNLWHHQQPKLALKRYTRYWIHAKRLPAWSKPLQQQWKQQHPTQQERWQRAATLIQHGKWKAAKQLTAALPHHQQTIQQWQSLQKNPEQLLHSGDIDPLLSCNRSTAEGKSAISPSLQAHDLRHELGKPSVACTEALNKSALLWSPINIAKAARPLILRDILKRLTRKDAGQAWRALQLLQYQQLISNNSKLQRYVALRAAKQHIPEAAVWLSQLAPSLQNRETRAWRARIALLTGNWPALLNSIEAMPSNEQQQARWLYWQARAYAALGNNQQAENIYQRLAKERGYYSFLSAEKLGSPLRFSPKTITASRAAISAIASRPAIQRAYEWLQIGQRNKAAREWYHAMQGATPQQWQAATILASQWQWYPQAIRAAHKAGKHDTLLHRFPLAFKDAVMQASTETSLTAAMIWSIIRQESAFNQQITSSAGAQGLMQLMPTTARQIAHKLHLRHVRHRLLTPAFNIRLGATYLATMMAKFDNLALAAAAYNAGPHRVNQWLKRTPIEDADAWIEAIPFHETRRYVQQVMAFVAVYEWRQSITPSSLSARLNRHNNQQVSMNNNRIPAAAM